MKESEHKLEGKIESSQQEKNKISPIIKSIRRPAFFGSVIGGLGIVGIIGAKEAINHSGQINQIKDETLGKITQFSETVEDKYDTFLQTSDQKWARNILENPQETNKLEKEGGIAKNLIVGADGANLRNSPHAEPSEPNQIGRLEPGTIVPFAIRVKGNIYRLYSKKPEAADWFAFFDPKKPNRVVFSYSGNFENN